MKRLTILLLAAVAIFTALPAIAQINPLLLDIPGCTVVRAGAFVTVGADTLWFTKAAPKPGALLHTATKADWIKPTLIGVGSDRNGNVLTETRRVKTVKLYSRQPFAYLAFYGTASAQDGVLSPGTVYAYVDSMAVGVPGPTSTKGQKFPCVALIPGYPDSVYIKEALSDTVKAAFGY